MKYCWNCNRITAGKPLFCLFCGKSYNVKLCPRRHANPRYAEACSQCGSRDLSTPQPKAPFWAPVLEIVLASIPGVILGGISLLAFGWFVRELNRSPQFMTSFFLIFIALGVLWWLWSQIPRSVRSFIYRRLKRKREHDGNGGH